MSDGYVGLRSRRRTRRLYFFIFLILLIGLIIFFALRINKIDNLESETENNEIDKATPSSTYDTNIFTIDQLEYKLFKKEQKIIDSEKLVSSYKNQILALEKSNEELIESLKKNNKKSNEKNLELENNNLLEIKEYKSKINNLNQEIKRIKNNFNQEIKKIKNNSLSINIENDLIKERIEILKNNYNKLNLEKDGLIKQIETLKNTNKEKNELIKELKDKFILHP